ncbi:MAG: M16 family metallopeptidase, partial [Acidimicrobiales bacterium]
PRAGGERPVRDAPVAPPRALAVDSQDTEQAHVVIGARALPAGDPDRFALAALNEVLGGGASSRLFQEVREQRGLAYAVHSSTAAFADAGTLTVYAGTHPARVDELIEVVHAEIARLAGGGVSERELAVARGHLRGSTVLGLEDAGARLGRLGRHQLAYGEVRPVEEALARFGALTVADLAEVGERVLSQPPVLAVIGPFAETDFAPAGRLPAGD